MHKFTALDPLQLQRSPKSYALNSLLTAVFSYKNHELSEWNEDIIFSHQKAQAWNILPIVILSSVSHCHGKSHINKGSNKQALDCVTMYFEVRILLHSSERGCFKRQVKSFLFHVFIFHTSFIPLFVLYFYLLSSNNKFICIFSLHLAEFRKWSWVVENNIF